MKKPNKPKRNQVTATFDDEIFDLIEDCVSRYGKGDRARVVVEIVRAYMPLYQAAEDAALAVRQEQYAALGKASAPATATTPQRRARK